MTHYIADDVHSQRHSGDYCPGALRRSPGSDNYGAYKGMEHERDEALAQVALLEKRIQEQLGHPGPLGSHKKGDDPHFSCPTCDWYGVVPAEARALLDRLQRAEAAVEALRKNGRHSVYCAAFGGGEWRKADAKICDCPMKALAAWEGQKE